MNHCGHRAQRYWHQHLPGQYAQIPDPEAFFAEMGETMGQQIEDLADRIAGADPPGETYLGKVGRLNRARQEAEMEILRETLPPPESTTVEDTTDR